MNSFNHYLDINSRFDETKETIEQIKINYDGKDYIMSKFIGMKIGFISGMTESGLIDVLALPLPAAQSVAQIGHKVLEFISNNSNAVSGMDYLQKVVLGGATSKEFIEQMDKSDISKIRCVLEQVFALVSLSDYWDCPQITADCSEFIALILSKADQQSVKSWFCGIV